MSDTPPNDNLIDNRICVQIFLSTKVPKQGTRDYTITNQQTVKVIKEYNNVVIPCECPWLQDKVTLYYHTPYI